MAVALDNRGEYLDVSAGLKLYKVISRDRKVMLLAPVTVPEFVGLLDARGNLISGDAGHIIGRSIGATWIAALGLAQALIVAKSLIRIGRDILPFESVLRRDGALLIRAAAQDYGRIRNQWHCAEVAQKAAAFHPCPPKKKFEDALRNFTSTAPAASMLGLLIEVQLA